MKMKRIMVYVSALISFLLLASPANAIYLDTGELDADCDSLSIHVTGRAWTGDNCTVYYVLDFDPALTSGSVAGFFEVPPIVSSQELENFEATFNWKFGDIPYGEYKITGSAELICESDPSVNPAVSLAEISLICPSEGDEGCGLGFWKNHLSCWCVDYDPHDLLSDVFEGIPDRFNGDTLIDALNYRGGHEYAMLRHAVAALLNACSDDVTFGLDEQYIKDTVIAALNGTGSVEAAHEEFEDANETGCPIDAHCDSIDSLDMDRDGVVDKEDVKLLKARQKDQKKDLKDTHKTEKTAMKAAMKAAKK